MSECYQIGRESSHIVRPGKKVLVRRHIDGSTTVWRAEQQLVFKKIDKRPEPLQIQKAALVPLSASTVKKPEKRKSP